MHDRHGVEAKYGINWTGPLIAKALGDVHVQYVWRFLRAHKIDLSGRKSRCQSNDPEFAAKAAEIVGLYMAPPENAIVLAVDEKPSMPTHASSLNQIEIWFSILAKKSLDGASFTRVPELVAHIDAFIADYNQTHQKRLKPRFADQ